MALEVDIEIYETQTVFLTARVLGPDGKVLTPSDVSGWTLNVFDLEAPTVAVFTTTQGAGAGFLLTPSTDADWPDDIGYNFAHSIFPATFAMQGGKSYAWEYVFQAVQYGVIARRFTIVCLPLLSL